MTDLMWVAAYNNGKLLLQYKEDGEEVSTALIDKSKLYQLRLMDNKGKIVALYEYKTGDYPFYRKRTAINASGVLGVVHIIGNRYKIGEEFKTHVMFVYEADLRTEIGDFKETGFEWKHPIELNEFDNIPVE